MIIHIIAMELFFKATAIFEELLVICDMLYDFPRTFLKIYKINKLPYGW